MSQIDKVEIIRRILIKDERGWFYKAINGLEPNLPHSTGEVYLTMGKPGQTKGSHYHPEALEWFSVIEGKAILILEDVFTHQRREIPMSLEEGITVFVPNNVAHEFVNIGDTEMIVVAYTDKLYDSKDTIPYKL